MRMRFRTRAAAFLAVAALLFVPLTAVIPSEMPRAMAQDAAPYFVDGAPGCNRVALIFNIGAGYEPATSILDTLSAYGVPATMFVMGWWAEQYPELVQRMANDGFPVGSHGYTAPELTSRSDDDVAWDVNASYASIAWALGYPAIPYFTPFAGSSDERVRWVIANQGYLPVGWGVDSGDWSPDATPDSVYANVVPNVYDGALVELHLDAENSAYSTAVALPWIIEALSAQGYQFVTVPQMTQPC